MQIDELEVMNLYDGGMSLALIAKEKNTYVNKILRILEKNGKKRRTRNEAQKLALENGVAIHPTLGTKRSSETKKKISEKSSSRWKEKTKEERADFVSKAKKRWEDMDDDKRKEILAKANEAIRDSAKNGSKLEKFIFIGLQKAGFNAIIHYEWMYGSDKTHIDIFIPDEGFAIEIDGPSHFNSIWGDDELMRTIACDNNKRGLILDGGLSFIRVKQFSKHISQKIQRDTLDSILKILNSKADSNNENYFEVEI